ncbi:outer membrane transport energization protein ExbB [Ancylobacter aquaticus]|uniref:Biopolymer transport protein ExbB n=1 Tax=Ancylobacter aquaticus TaxID=100 RepID=A0A4R1IAQ2_ANCAQ|nr:tonB-system energizer ExbB [Ancylobacter aquaticus]TCK31353.1 outer membrane transport energization protein ExbB [Ancylobacter aquaticus]
MPTTPTTLAQRPALNLLLALAMLVAGPVAAWAQVQQPAPALSTPAPATPAPATPAPATTTPSAPATAAPVPAAPAPSTPAPAVDPLVPPAPGMTAPATGGQVSPPAGDAATAVPPAAAPAGDAPVVAPAAGEVSADPSLSGLPLDQSEDPSVAAQLPHDLSPWGMFMAADWVVKAVMIGLAFASVVTWTVWLAKTMELAVAKGRLRRALKGYLASATLDEARRVDPRGPAGAMLRTTDLELQRSGPLPADGIKERVSISLSRIEVAAGRAITRGTGLLATIGATAPFVGLFGTVWGIMNSFIGISKAQTTNLAVVAPGIAEALLATAIGLVAAIPAVVIYNHFSRQVSGYRVLMGDASAEVLRLLSRDLDRRDASRSAAHRVRTAAE